MVWYCEDHVTMHIELLSKGLYCGAGDDEKQVKEHVRVRFLRTVLAKQSWFHEDDFIFMF